MTAKLSAKHSKAIAELDARLTEICGNTHVKTDAQSRDFFAQDLYEKGVEPDIIVAPQTTAQLGQIVNIARKFKRALYIRGGGMSYSNAFMPARDGAIMVDSRNMNAIREINVQDLYVTVEAGCTWAVLDAALAEHGLRAVFWGPYSGGKATIGGSISQGTANNASAAIGTSDSAVLGYEIVTGRGEILQTGKNSQKGHKPFTRTYGPDLTSIFSNDAGALGLKTAITLKLEKRPKAYGGVSYACESFDAMMAAIEAGAQCGLAKAVIAMDAKTAGVRAGKRGLKEDFGKLMAVIKTAHNPLLGLWRGVKIALAGGRVFERAKYTVHFLLEAPSDKLLASQERYMRSLINPHGQELPSVAISMMRIESFPDLPLTHMDGRRMLPIHGILPFSEMRAYASAYDALIDSYAERLDAAQITVADIYSVIGNNSLLCEPVFYWPDSHSRYQREMSSDIWTDNWPDEVAANLPARELIAQLKDEVIDLQYRHSAAHIQIGKQYPYMQGREAVTADFISGLKAQLDPDNIINPGALGL